MPLHLMFPINIVYQHTNYYKIYDLAKYRDVEIYIEIYENSILLGFLFYSIIFEYFSIKNIVTITFVLSSELYFILALFYYLFIHDDYIRQKIKMIGNNEYLESISSEDEVKDNVNSLYPLKDKINILELDDINNKVFPRTSAPVYRPDLNLTLTEQSLNVDPKFLTQRSSLVTEANLLN